MWKTVRNIIIALVIIGLGAVAGWQIAVLTNPNATPTTNAAATPTVGRAATVTAAPAGSPGATVVANAGNPGGATTPAGNPANGTPASGGATTPAAQTGQGQNQAGQGGQGQRAQQITGTVESYDAAGKKLVVNTGQGSRTIMTTNARYSKTAKFTSEELTQLAAGPLLIVGEKGSDGIYTARTITSVDPNGFGGGAAGFGGGAPGGGQAGGAAGGNRGGQAGGGAGGFGGGMLILPSSTFKDGVLSGQTFQGEAVQVKLSPNTNLLKQVAGAESDLKAGANVSITARTDGDNLDATIITINA